MKTYGTLFSRVTGPITARYYKTSTALLCIVLLAAMSCGVTNNDDDENMSDLEMAKLRFEQLIQKSGNITIPFPDQDPGIPIYARVGPILNQFFVTNGRIVIPFYRDPGCIPDDFNFLTYYDPPTAFGCDLTVQGRFVIENDAEQGDFPIMAHTTGTQVPVWIVDWPGFQALLENESVTLSEIEALNPVKGVAQQYEEYLSPRFQEHEVIIEASGTIPGTSQKFNFGLTHRGDQIEGISLVID
ncbi:MAG: hypothetical protein LC662_13395 [Rhodothermaceae bacterium]|nr:hypothetical protein [Rhodothermaceae bacterium]